MNCFRSEPFISSRCLRRVATLRVLWYLPFRRYVIFYELDYAIGDDGGREPAE